MRERSEIQRASSAGAFERRYRQSADPWNYRSAPYERAKYRTTLEALSRPCYSNAFEPGCSIGELTALLAPRCGHLLAVDVSSTAVLNARLRCRGFPQVDVECADLLNMTLPSQFDLIVLSEIAYYFDVQTLSNLATALAEALVVGGELVAVHWRGHSVDHLLHADEAHRALLRALPMSHRIGQRHPGFRIDGWIKESVA